MNDQLRQRLMKALQQLEFLAEEAPLIELGGQQKAQELASEAHQLLLELAQPRTVPEPQPADPRILRQVGKLRLVAPARRACLNGALLIERRETDALGAERWVAVTEVSWDSGIEAVELASGRAIFRLLAGDGWDDQELREYDK